MATLSIGADLWWGESKEGDKKRGGKEQKERRLRDVGKE
jgi:hypothetical protein